MTVNDEGPDGNIETQCANAPAIFGDRVGGDPPHTGLLAAFDGLDISGSWTLNVSDAASGHGAVVCGAGAASGEQWRHSFARPGSVRCAWQRRHVYPISNTGSVTDTFDLTVDDEWATVLSTVVTYTLQISSTGNTTDTFSLNAANDNGWLSDLSANSIMLAAGARETVLVTVHVPADAVDGAMNVPMVTAVSNNNPADPLPFTGIAERFQKV